MAGLLERIEAQTQLAGFNRLALLLFRLDERQIFGINVLKVVAVQKRPALTHMPSAHPFVAGIAEIRGQVMPVIDMWKALDRDGDSSSAHLIVSEFSRSTQAFLVRSVDRIIHVDVDRVRPPPAAEQGPSYLTAVTEVGQQTVEIIDVERILSEIVGEMPALEDTVADLASVQRALAGRSVLVADDSRVARGHIQRVLDQLGIPAIMLNDGRQALSYLQKLAMQPGAIEKELLMLISDVEMPDMDGYRLTTEIRRDPRMAGLYVLLHSSLSGIFNQAMVKKVGADRFLAKLNADELARAVLDQLNLQQAA
ncbi:MAG: Two-component system, chemotaxis family, response regulator CheV [Hydrocarboniphaga sp.]|uniref:chemotaxis protein CheV n=1 Tax=Hydrocarboniphaga sp. TaxID=2033016 RepID=UPI002628D8DE|nr:chemotaxis protein CheV [Hydrocarboniphaga sp.]MDB5967598.1 Two-component system, chemotaxis family, response regulator CheV [Hydrocarboniphaga sp.]